jgi:hypothetical protein
MQKKMYTKPILNTLISFIVLVSIFSCSNDSDQVIEPINREVKYELTGTASGQFAKISVIYFAANGTAQSESAITLPWSKSVTINNDVPAITLQTTVSNATQGQTITAKIIVGGVVKIQETATVKANGDVSLALPGYSF